MAQKYDPQSLFVGHRLLKDTNDAGVIVDENTGEWKSGKVLVELFDKKTGESVAGHTEDVTRNKYLAFREDFDQMTTEQVAEKYFKDVTLGERSQTALQKEAEHSAAETKERELQAKVDELQAELDRREQMGDDYVTNVRPVGDPGKEVSNPEQASAEDMMEQGATAEGGPDNPEQTAPNVSEDESKKRGGNTEKESATNSRKSDAKPVGSNAKTNKEVAESK